MTTHADTRPLRCTRCGHEAQSDDKFCAECGMFLRDAFVDQRLLLALEYEREGRCEAVPIPPSRTRWSSCI